MWLWVLAACEPMPLQGIFLGELPTTAGVRAAVAAGEQQVTVYIAGDAETLEFARLFEGPRDESGAFSASTDGWQVTGGPVEVGEAFTLIITDPDGMREPEFTLQPPTDPNSIDGPYRGTGPGGCVAGAVVYNSGGQAIGASCAPDGTKVLIDAGLGSLIEVGGGSIEVQVDHGTGPEPLVLDAVRPDGEEPR